VFIIIEIDSNCNKNNSIALECLDSLITYQQKAKHLMVIKFSDEDV